MGLEHLKSIQFLKSSPKQNITDIIGRWGMVDINRSGRCFQGFLV